MKDAPTVQTIMIPVGNLFIQGTLNSGHLSNEDSAYCPSYIEMCTKLPLKEGHLSNEDSAYCPSYREMCTKLPLKEGHLSNEDTWACHKEAWNREVTTAPTTTTPTATPTATPTVCPWQSTHEGNPCTVSLALAAQKERMTQELLKPQLGDRCLWHWLSEWRMAPTRQQASPPVGPQA